MRKFMCMAVFAVLTTGLFKASYAKQPPPVKEDDAPIPLTVPEGMVEVGRFPISGESPKTVVAIFMTKGAAAPKVTAGGQLEFSLLKGEQVRVKFTQETEVWATPHWYIDPESFKLKMKPLGIFTTNDFTMAFGYWQEFGNTSLDGSGFSIKVKEKIVD